MITITTDQDRLFNLVIQKTVYYSHQLDRSVDKADIIPMTEDDRALYETFLRQAANAVWEKIAAYAAADEEEPFVLDYEQFAESTGQYTKSVLFLLDEPTGWVSGAQKPMLENAIDNALTSYVVSEWLRMKGFDANWSIEWQKYLDALDKVKSAIMFKNTASLTYKTF